MIRINLLPWRAQIRQQKMKRFGMLIGAGVLVALFLLLLWHLFVRGELNHQTARNNFLQAEIDKQAAAITDLNRKKRLQSQILTDLKFIFNLREKSYRSVQVMDELAKLTPEAISLTRIIRQGSQLTLIGEASANSEVTVYLRQLSDSPLFDQPNLTQIASREEEDGQARRFEIQVKIQDEDETKR